MLATALNTIIGQRLVRKLATKQEYEPNKSDDLYIKQIIKEIKSNNEDISVDYDGKLRHPKSGKNIHDYE